ncbi:MAG TPA: acyl-CoA carboxylase epsilon subunit, partial [Streptosporangiaceae bacterium]|nr:acyl-CoA carboxylase epsilon subunit [Streptosporangiaceae bacterium]
MAERPELSPLDISIVRGDPNLEELAVLIAVLQTRDVSASVAPGVPAGSARTTPSAGPTPAGATPSAAAPSTRTVPA